MAQLRQDYGEFVKRNTEVIVAGPDGPNAFKRFWAHEGMPFVGLSDIGNQIARLYFQEFNLFKFGWMPAMFILDLTGMIRYRHYGNSMADIPENAEILKILDSLRTYSG